MTKPRYDKQEFDLEVYDVVGQIPPGKVLSYGRIAHLIGMPGHARRVGRAMGFGPSRTQSALPPGRPKRRRSRPLLACAAHAARKGRGDIPAKRTRRSRTVRLGNPGRGVVRAGEHIPQVPRQCNQANRDLPAARSSPPPEAHRSRSLGRRRAPEFAISGRQQPRAAISGNIFAQRHVLFNKA